MTEDERIETFLEVFKKLEKELLGIADLKDDFVSFSRALNHVYYHRLNPVLAKRDNYDFLKTASDVRNILSHENRPIAPTEEFLSQFLALANAIINPLDCYEVSTKQIVTCTYGNKVLDIMKLMNDQGISHIPVLDHRDGHVVGIFSRDVFFDYLLENIEVSITEESTVGDFRSVLALENHHNEQFLFVERYLSVSKAFRLLLKEKAHDRAVALLLVTEHGKPKERLLGIITLTDLARLSAQNII